MNTTRYLLAAAFAVGIFVQFPCAHAATVVTTSTKPVYTVTTVQATGPYRVISPAPCCYTRVVVKSAPSTATVAVVPPPKPPVRVVYVAPPVTVYPTRVVYPSTGHYSRVYYVP